MVKRASDYDSSRYHDGFDGDMTESDWLDEFRKKPESVIHALETWANVVRSLSWDVTDLNHNLAPKYGAFPPYFHRLTQIIALWCDVQLHIDPTPFFDVLARMAEALPHQRQIIFKYPVKSAEDYVKDDNYRVALSDEDIQKLSGQWGTLWHRVLHATLALAPEYHRVRKVAADIQRGMIIVDGQPHRATAHHCQIVAKLVDAEGLYVTGLELNALPCCHGKKISREMNAIEKAVPAIKKYLKREGAKGYRIIF